MILYFDDNDLERLDSLPKRENRAAHLTKKYGNMYNTNLDYPRSWHTDENPFKIADRLLKHYTDKPFDDLWADWSERAKHSDLIRENKDYIWKRISHGNGIFRAGKYYVDENGILRFTSK